MATKVCSKCGEEKDVGEFYRRHCQCKECMKEYQKEYRNTDKSKEYQKEYQREYRKKDGYRERQKKYRKTDKSKEYQKEYQRAYRKTDKGKEYQKEYTKKCRKRDTVKYRNKRADAKDRGVEFYLSKEQFVSLLHTSECHYCKNAIQDITALLSFIHEYGEECKNVLSLRRKISLNLLTKDDMTIDRLDSSKGYVDGNCVPACVICNIAKGFLIPPDQYKLIAPAVIDNIVRICKEAGMSVPLPSSELGTEHECGEGGGSMDGGLLHGGRALFEAALDVPVPEVCDPVGSLPRLLRDAQ
jgi:hypothetical protein